MIYANLCNIGKYRSRAQEFLRYMRDIKLYLLLDLRVGLNMMNNIVLTRLAILNLHASFIISIMNFGHCMYVDGKGSFESQTSFNNAKQLPGNSIASVVARCCFHFNRS